MTGVNSGDSLLPVLKNEIRAVRTALWFRPTAYCTLAILLAVLVATVDGFLPKDLLDWLPKVKQATVEELLKLLAGGMLTVATVTLSVLMLVLSIAAGQASPRAVPEVMADPVTQNALGTFLATFVYALTALLLFGVGAVAGPGVTLIYFGALLLALNAVRYLVQWIHHVADSLKVNRIVHRIHRQAALVLDGYLEAEEEGGRRVADPAGAGDQDEVTEVFPEASGYVQLIDASQLSEIVRGHDLRLELCLQEGDFAHPRRPMMLILGRKAADEEDLAALRAAVVLGFERSHKGDPRLGFELLAEVACRALSPGINDPQTALVCINYLGSLLTRAAQTPAKDYPAGASSDGRIGFVRPDFGALLERAVRPVIREGAGSAEVINAVMAVLADLVHRAAADHLDVIIKEAQRAEDFGLAVLQLDVDKKALTDRAKQVRESAADRRG
ncbi:MAG: DUF2254 domain-containing protein [Kiloniellaceae bacterium]